MLVSVKVDPDFSFSYEQDFLGVEDLTPCLIVKMWSDFISARPIHIGQLLRELLWGKELDPLLAEVRTYDQPQKCIAMENLFYPLIQSMSPFKVCDHIMFWVDEDRKRVINRVSWTPEWRVTSMFIMPSNFGATSCLLVSLLPANAAQFSSILLNRLGELLPGTRLQPILPPFKQNQANLFILPDL